MSELTESQLRVGGKQKRYDDLFVKVCSSMNSVRYRPLRNSELSLVWEVCVEALDELDRGREVLADA